MATKANIVIDQGTTFSTTLELTDENDDLYDLSNYTASSKMKKWYTSTNSVEFSTAINNDTSEITLSLTAEQTDLIEAGRYVYDVEIVDNSGTVIRLLEGIVTVTPSVTK